MSTPLASMLPFPLHTDPLLAMALIIAAGMLSGSFARRLGLPGVTGQVLVGVLMGHAGLQIFANEVLHELQPLTHFALGLMAVTVGSHLHLRALATARRRLGWLILLESTLTPLCVFIALKFVPSIPKSLALLLAALAIATAPATIIAVVKESRAKGVFVKTLVAAVALNNIACIALFEIAREIARTMEQAPQNTSAWALIQTPALHLLCAALLGVAVGLGLVAGTCKTLRPERLTTASFIAILATVGLADYFGLSGLLSCMFLGATLANVVPNKEEIGHRVFLNFESAILAVFFVLAGMELHLEALLAAGWIAALVVAARALGKVLAARLAMKLSYATERLRKNLGLALLPQAGVAIGLILSAREDPALAGLSETLLAIGLAGVTLNEIIGPVMTRLSLKRAGETDMDRARVMDFLTEENIRVDIRPTTRQKAIALLVETLGRNHSIGKDALAAYKEQVLMREAAAPTYAGHGLCIPHGQLETGRGVVGVMGICRAGLLDDTPDGQPIHCIVLLATPKESRDRHLEVLAAMATAIGSSPAIRRSLYHVDTPAHAYDLLHAGDAVDFNTFLEEDDLKSE